jgi:hypothetical protein
MRMFRKAALAAMSRLSGSLTNPGVAAAGYFTLRLTAQADSGGTLIHSGTYMAPSAWHSGVASVLYVSSGAIPPNGYRDLGLLHIPCSQDRYEAVKAAAMASSLYGNYQQEFSQQVPSALGIDNGLGVKGYLRHYWSGPVSRTYTASWVVTP